MNCAPGSPGTQVMSIHSTPCAPLNLATSRTQRIRCGSLGWVGGCRCTVTTQSTVRSASGTYSSLGSVWNRANQTAHSQRAASVVAPSLMSGDAPRSTLIAMIPRRCGVPCVTCCCGCCLRTTLEHEDGMMPPGAPRCL